MWRSSGTQHLHKLSFQFSNHTTQRFSPLFYTIPHFQNRRNVRERGGDRQIERKREKEKEINRLGEGQKGKRMSEKERGGCILKKDCNKSARLISDVGSQKHDHWTSLLFLKTHYLSHSCFITYFGCKKVILESGKVNMMLNNLWYAVIMALI